MRPTCIRDYEYEQLLFFLAPNEDYIGWEFTISDLIETEFEAKPDNFTDKSAKIEFLKGLIADIEKCIEKWRMRRELLFEAMMVKRIFL